MPAPARFVRTAVRTAVRSAVGSAVVAGAVLLAGCSSSSSPEALDPAVLNLQPGEPGEPNEVVTVAPPEELFPQSSFSGADVAFMRDMQVHHEQALVMTAMVEERTEREELRLFVRRMETSQTAELEQLERLLAEHTELVRRSGGAGHDDSSEHGDDGEMSGMTDMSGASDMSAMPGMLTDERLAELEAADGDEFARLFLVSMSQHHEGALAMVGELFSAEDAAADPRLYAFAENVDSDQRIELDRMAQLYAELPPA